MVCVLSSGLVLRVLRVRATETAKACRTNRQCANCYAGSPDNGRDTRQYRPVRENCVHSGNGGQPRQTESPPPGRLPPGLAIEKLPVLGTTWYERGPGYWVRRVWLFLLMALVVTLMSLLVGGFLLGIKGSSHTGFVWALIVEIAWSLVIIGYLMIRTAQRWNNLEPARPLSRRQREAGAAGGALGVLATAGIFIAQAVLVIGSVLFFGLYVSLLIYALLPEWPPEHKARLRLAGQLGEQARPPSSPAPPIALGP
jgi:hypothetical protein